MTEVFPKTMKDKIKAKIYARQNECKRSILDLQSKIEDQLKIIEFLDALTDDINDIEE